MRPIQAREEKRGSSSSSSRRPWNKKRFIKRDWEEAHEHLYKDYFVEDFVYNETHFRRRFWMQRHLFLRIVDTLQSRFEFFQQRSDALERRGLSPITKCTTTIWMLSYGISADCVSEYLKISESTAIERMNNFAAESFKCSEKSIYKNQLKLMLIVGWRWRRLVIFLVC